MHPPQSTEHVEESTSMREMYRPALLCRDQPTISRKVSLANSQDKASTEGGSVMLFVRSFTRDDLTDKSDSDSQSSRDSSTTRVQERRRRNLIRCRIGSMNDMEKSCSGKRFDEPSTNRKSMHLEGMGLLVKKKHLNDDDSFSSLSYGVHDEDDDSLDSCDQPVDLAYSKSSEMETCVQQQEQGIIITPGIDDLSSNSNKKHKVDEIHNYAIAHDMLLQLGKVDKRPFLTRQVSFQDMMKILNRICSICQTSFFIGGYACPCNYCGTFFHRGCLMRWLNHRSTCPFCLRPVNCTSDLTESNLPDHTVNR